MAKLVRMTLTTADGAEGEEAASRTTILVEAADDDLRAVGAGTEVVEAVDQLYGRLVRNEIVENCRVLIGAFEELQKQAIAPSKGTAEFGLQFTGEGNVYLVKASAQASIKIGLEWQLSPPK